MNAGLLLEQIRHGPDDTLNALDADLRRLAGVSRGSGWRDLYPNRDNWIGE